MRRHKPMRKTIPFLNINWFNSAIVFFLLLLSFLLSVAGSKLGIGTYNIGFIKISLQNVQIFFYVFLVLRLIPHVFRYKKPHAKPLYNPQLKIRRNRGLFFLGISLLLISFFFIYKDIVKVYFIYDDFVHLEAVKQGFFDGWTNLSPSIAQNTKIFRPIPFISLWINYKVFALNHFYYRFIDITIHLFIVLLIILISYYILHDVKLAFFVGFLFAFWPAHLEVFGVGGQDLLADFFCLSSFLSFILYRKRKRPLYLIASISSCAAALCCKESMIFLPFALASYDFIIPEEGGRLLKEKIKIACLFLLVLFFYFIIRLRVTGFIVGGYTSRAGGSRLAFLGPLDYLNGIFLQCFRPFFFPINWLAVARLNLFWVRYLLFGYSFIMLAIISLNIIQIPRNRPALFGLFFIFVFSIPIAGLWGIGDDASGGRFYYIAMFGFYLFLAALLKKQKFKNIILSFLVFLNIFFFCINRIPRLKAGEISHKIVSQTKALFPDTSLSSKLTLYYYDVINTYDGSPCLGGGLNEALSLTYAKFPPEAVRVDYREDAPNLKSLDLGNSEFVLRWNERSERLEDITGQLKVFLKGNYRIDKALEEKNIQDINNLSLWRKLEFPQQKDIPNYACARFGVVSPQVAIASGTAAALTVKMKIIPANKRSYSVYYKGRLHWTSDKSNGFREDKFRDFFIMTNENFNIYKINFIGPDEIFNKETIMQFLFIPALFDARIEIAEIKLDEY